MAKIVKEVGRPHDCQAELKQELGQMDLMPGSVAECSCGNRFERRDDQRDGLYWMAVAKPSSDGWPYEPGPCTSKECR